MEPEDTVARQRGWAIYETVKRRPLTDVRIADLAQRLDIPKSATGAAMAQARNIAQSEGGLITFCDDPDRGYLLCYMDASHLDQVRLFRRTLQRQKSVTAQTINLAPHLEFGAAHVADPLFKQWFKTQATIARAAVDVADTVNDLATAILNAQQAPRHRRS